MIDEEGKKILTALADLSKPSSGKKIAEASCLESKKVTSKIKSLKNKGLVENPARCKYSITVAGKKVL
ncbi:MAG: hypothetical protein P9X24_06785 [Candidatus Hatepunaea meridiana]|nr:hypothetical protein [Candidatus Hatepunaea meridiana]